MKKLLLINGHDVFQRAKGQLTDYMVDLIREECKHHIELKETKIIAGYNTKEEIGKFQWADIVILQTPIYWFSIPGIVKKYIDDVFVPDIFFTKAKKFGRGGLLTQKEYMLSVSWGANIKAFNGSQTSFLEGYSEDEVLFPIHKIFEYCGLNRLPTFSIYSAMKNQSLKEYTSQLQDHLRRYIVKGGGSNAL
ncbi:NAD(P)H-dependent oxidoreductase [Oceanobacillus profundus]|uniref:NAD(P)H-dependent oxidoreductase n=1 Tax=Oceanobacillus TaxID=182709 RepID=UPI0026E11D4F|nr:NAD(P)H-dependent oxidoreductase [Oceanobacillus profundus]MDO6448507.1 NAD(P)H-dependent oxidoreductase [Oceanobacillus profundus]